MANPNINHTNLQIENMLLKLDVKTYQSIRRSQAQRIVHLERKVDRYERDAENTQEYYERELRHALLEEMPNLEPYENEIEVKKKTIEIHHIAGHMAEEIWKYMIKSKQLDGPYMMKYLVRWEGTIVITFIIVRPDEVTIPLENVLYLGEASNDRDGEHGVNYDNTVYWLTHDDGVPKLTDVRVEGAWKPASDELVEMLQDAMKKFGELAHSIRELTKDYFDVPICL